MRTGLLVFALGLAACGGQPAAPPPAAQPAAAQTQAPITATAVPVTTATPGPTALPASTPTPAKVEPTLEVGSTSRPSNQAMSEKLLYDFESPAEISQWRNQDDPVMGGRSRSQAGAGLQSTLVFAGRVSLENNGGFAAVRSFGLPQAVDISAYTAIQLRVLGDGKVYAFTLTTGTAPNLLYEARFRTTPGEWMTITLPYSDFEPTRFGFRPPGAPALNARDIRVLGFIISDKQAGPFELGVDWIKAVK